MISVSYLSENNIEYPCIRQLIEYPDTVVLFTGAKEGFYLSVTKADTDYKVGQAVSDSISPATSKHWRPIREITLRSTT